MKFKRSDIDDSDVAVLSHGDRFVNVSEWEGSYLLSSHRKNLSHRTAKIKATIA
jgi:hypothetical protein